MSYFFKNAQAEDYRVRSQRLCIPFSIVHSATPANKTNSNDLGAVMTLSLEGQTATAAAIDANCNFTTPVDATGIFGVLLANLGLVQKIQRVSVDMLSSGTAAITLNGVSNSGVTLVTSALNPNTGVNDAAGQNIALSIDWSGNLATTDLSACLSIDYTLASN